MRAYLALVVSLLLVQCHALKAVIYTGFAAYCEDGKTRNSACWDAAGYLLANSSLDFDIEFMNQTQVLKANLSQVDLFVQPGGGNNDTSWENVWKDIEPLASKIRSYVELGGRYMGFCQGGYLAGNFSNTAETKGYNMLPSNVAVDQECIYNPEKLSPWNDDTSDEYCGNVTTLQIDYERSNGQLWKNQSVIFQDGTVIFETDDGCSDQLQILGTYPDGNYSIGFVAFGKGIVGFSGPHIEADYSFFEDCDVPEDGCPAPVNPSNYKEWYKIGLDFVDQLVAATPESIQKKASASCKELDTDAEEGTEPELGEPNPGSNEPTPSQGSPPISTSALIKIINKLLKLVNKLTDRLHKVQEEVRHDGWEYY